MSDSGSSPEKNGFKSLLVKGVVSAVALAGTTAIPIVIQRSLQSPSAPTSPVPVSPTQAAPLPDSQQMGSAETTHQAIGQDEDDDKHREKGKKKR